MDLIDFLAEKMWEIEASGMETADVAVEGSQITRWVVRMRMPDLRGKKRSSSGSMSTDESIWHSTSLGLRTGRPLFVRSAPSKKSELAIFQRKSSTDRPETTV